MNDPERRHHSIAEPPHNPWSHNRVALEEHSWFNDTNNQEAVPGYSETSHHHGGEDNHQHGDDLPPTYEGSDLPAYDIDDPDAPPLHTFHLQQVSRGLQIFTPSDLRQDYTYQLITRTSPKLFSKKADITLLRSAAFETGNTTASTNDNSEERTSTANNRSPLRRGSSTASAPPATAPDPSHPPTASSGTTMTLAKINFDDNAQLPWKPRATIALLPSSQSISLTCSNFRVWRLDFPPSPTLSTGTADADAVKYTWSIPDYGPVYRLYSSAFRRPIAMFSHTAHGTRARNGDEVGVLRVYRVFKVPAGPDVETVVGSLAIAMAQVRRMGRHTVGGGGAGALEGRLIESGLYRSMSMGVGGSYVGENMNTGRNA